MKTKNFILSSLCIIIICSCEGDTIDPNKGGRTLQLQAEIDGSMTRVSDSSWEKDDAIGVYMVKAGQPLNSSALRQNVKYVTSGSSTFKPANKADEIVLPFDGSNVDFIGYSPYREDIRNFSYPIDLSNQSVQAYIDLIYSDNAKNFNSKNPNVQMQFSHQLSKIVLNIDQEESTDLSDLSVIITNAGVQTTFDLSTGTLSAAPSRGNIQLRVNNDGSVAEAILLPEADLSGMDLWFIIGEEGTEGYKFHLADAMEIDAFEKSTKYTYNVTLFTERIVAVTESNITGWIDGPSEDIKADRTNETPPLVKGSKKDPYTVMEAKNNQGKTGVWVKGFIVGSFDRSINNFIPGVEGATPSNIALADIQGETDTDKMIPVQLPSSGSVRAALNIPDNPDNINKMVAIKGNPANYFSVPGLRELKEYVFMGSEP